MTRMFCTLMFLAGIATAFGIDYDQFFTDKTLRVDYIHTGTAEDEFFSIDQIYQEGEWPGNRVNIVDTLNYGLYLAKIYDLATNQLIYSYGYSSIFGEWQTTDEALDGVYKSLHETVRLPLPQKPIQFVIAKRNNENVFTDLYSTTIDPNSRFVNREPKPTRFKVRKIINNGDPATHVDLLILGDGYGKQDRRKFRRDVKRYVDVLFETEPFKSRRGDFNVWAIDVVSPESGIDEPRKNIWRRTAMDVSFNSLDLPRYVLSLNNKAIRDIAAAAPYDHLYLLFNSSRYGGGGIYHSIATCHTGAEGDDPGWWSDYVFVHEFGHSFAGLGDEYYSSQVAYNDFYPSDVEPWEPNITNLVNFDEKWKSLLPDSAAIPTPWAKAEYDSLARAAYSVPDKQRPAVRAQMESILHAPQFDDVVGVFQGAGYSSEGMYRPAADCRMFSKSMQPFCPVCRQAIERKIDFETQ